MAVDNTRTNSGTPARDVNGFELTQELTTGLSVLRGPAQRGQESVNREATRYLAAATQIDTKYAESVTKRVLSENLRALAPTFGIDISVVTKWAMKALQTRGTRDSLLAATLVLQIIFITLSALLSPWLLLSVPLLFVVAWMIVAWEYWVRIHKTVIGRMLRDRFDPATAPSPEREAKLSQLRNIAERAEGNLVVFSGHTAFVGAGEAVYRQRLLLDITSKKTADEDTAPAASDFTAQDIHTAIVEAFGHDRGLGRSLSNIRVGERLFVNGRHIQSDKRLLPATRSAPTATVDRDLLTEAAEHPSPEARTYVCVEMPGWQGQLVVTLFARAVYTGNSLFVEWTFRVLPPLKKEFLHIDELYELPRRYQLRNSLNSGLRSLVPALFCSPIRAMRPRVRQYLERRRRKRLCYAIEHGYVFDYGALRSIREDACGKQRGHYFLARDETMYVLLAQQTLIQAVRNFLSENGIELAQFDKQAQVIFDQSIHIGDITGSMGVAIGKNTSATVGDSQTGTEK